MSAIKKQHVHNISPNEIFLKVGEDANNIILQFDIQAGANIIILIFVDKNIANHNFQVSIIHRIEIIFLLLMYYFNLLSCFEILVCLIFVKIRKYRVFEIPFDWKF